MNKILKFQFYNYSEEEKFIKILNNIDIEKIKRSKKYKDVIKQLKGIINSYERVKHLSPKRIQYIISDNCLTVVYIGKCYNYTSKEIEF